MIDTHVFTEPSRDVVTVVGADARSFVQALVSQELATLSAGEGVHSLLLHPQGKLDVAHRVFVIDDETLWLDTDRGFGSSLAASLNRFRIRVKCTVSDVSDEMGTLMVRGSAAATIVGAASGALVPNEAHHHAVWPGTALRIVRVDWPGVEGVDVIGPRTDLAAITDQLVAAGAGVGTGDDYERLRIAAGVPRMGAELDDSVIAQEAFLERTAVSFTKGCFIGQELVCRIDSRGHVNRFLRHLRFDTTGSAPRVGDTIEREGKTIGVVTSVADGVALGYVRREVEPPATVNIVGQADRALGAIAATVEVLPA